MLFHTAQYLLFIVWLLACASCATGKLHLNQPVDVYKTSEHPDFTLYALGDAGAFNEQSKSVIKSLAAETADDMQPGAVIYLGDNVYPAGLAPEENAVEHLHGQEILLNQITPLVNYNRDILFIPGNHDWNSSKPGGLDAMKRQGDFIKSLNNSKIKLIPQQGCGDPQAIALTPKTTMILFDSEWWIQDWEKEPDMNKGCSIQSRAEFMSAFKKLVQENKDKQLIISMHHPLYSQGTHGGYFPWRDHIFPMTRVVDWLYVPLPVIGSIYPLYRNLFGHSQDTQHPNYRSLKDQILSHVAGIEDVVFLSGHDHNMQYTRRDGNHHLISGAGSKQNRVSNSRDLIYGHMAPGFMQLDVFEQLGVRLTIYEVEVETGDSKEVYSDFIIKK